MIRYTVKKNGVATNTWTSDFAGADYYEPCFGSPGDYVVESEDITAQEVKKDLIQKGKSAQDVGALVIAQVWAINESKQLTSDQLQALLADSTLATIERLLWNGSLKTAKLVIAGASLVAFTTDEKQEILDLLQSYIDKIGY